MKSLLNEISKGKILVSDGAWGTFLHKRGLQAGECPEEWNLTRRDDVHAIAKSYVDAGSDIIMTNSFGGSPIKLKHYGLENEAEKINKAAGEISREAAGEQLFVLGSMGPTGVMLITGEVTEQELYEGFKIQAKGLALGGVDAICIETMSDLEEARIAIKAAKETTGLEIFCTFTFEKTITGDFRSMMGVSPGDMVAVLKDAGASVIGTNCGNGFENMIDIVKQIRKVDADIPILVQANAGKPVYQDGATVFPETPEMMASLTRQLIKSGANIIGGCCGTTPDHIRALVKEIRAI